MFPGMAEHAIPFRTLGDALFMRKHLIEMLEMGEVEEDGERKRQLLTFVVAGGGYAGVEVAAETHAFVRDAAKSYGHIDTNEVRVVLLQRSGRSLPELTPALAEFSHRLLERRGIEIRLNTSIEGATAQKAILGNGEIIPAATLVSAVGAAPNRLLEGQPFERDKKGRVVVDETLAVPGCPGLWAVGDCAAIPDVLRGGTCPPTAQYVLREGKHVARNILSVVNGKATTPFRHKYLGVFVALGRFSGAAEVFGMKVSGILAWWLYRTYYFLQIPLLDRKAKVLIDWNLKLLFRGDIVQPDVSRSGRTSRSHYDAGETFFARESWRRPSISSSAGRSRCSASRTAMR